MIFFSKNVSWKSVLPKRHIGQSTEDCTLSLLEQWITFEVFSPPILFFKGFSLPSSSLLDH